MLSGDLKDGSRKVKLAPNTSGQRTGSDGNVKRQFYRSWVLAIIATLLIVLVGLSMLIWQRNMDAYGLSSESKRDVVEPSKDRVAGGRDVASTLVAASGGPPGRNSPAGFRTPPSDHSPTKPPAASPVSDPLDPPASLPPTLDGALDKR